METTKILGIPTLSFRFNHEKNTIYGWEGTLDFINNRTKEETSVDFLFMGSDSFDSHSNLIEGIGRYYDDILKKYNLSDSAKEFVDLCKTIYDKIQEADGFDGYFNFDKDWKTHKLELWFAETTEEDEEKIKKIISKKEMRRFLEIVENDLTNQDIANLEYFNALDLFVACIDGCEEETIGEQVREAIDELAENELSGDEFIVDYDYWTEGLFHVYTVEDIQNLTNEKKVEFYVYLSKYHFLDGYKQYYPNIYEILKNAYTHSIVENVLGVDDIHDIFSGYDDVA